MKANELSKLVSKLKVLLVTGTLARETVERHARKSGISTKVLTLNVPVAAFLTASFMAEELKKLNLNDFDVILVPGLVRGDVSIITSTTGIPTFKGPRYAADLPTILDALEKVELSTNTPACELLSEELQQQALQELDLAEKDREILLKNRRNMLINEMAIGPDFPMRIMAEIVDAPLISEDEIRSLAKLYVKNGADIIDVGMIADESSPQNARRTVEIVKGVVKVPVCIDTLNPDEAREAVSAGADLILSVDAGNVDQMATFASEVGVVVIPTNQREGYFPRGVKERVNFLEEIIVKAKKLGIKKIIGDLVLEPANVLGSLVAFRDFANKNPNIPLFIGVSNVTELIDADSVGVNALITYLSSEIGASMLLATEKSDKAKGSVREMVIASKMMFLAKQRGSVPKDLGIDLLVLKDKRKRETPYQKEFEKEIQVVTATEANQKSPIDIKGLFKITLDRSGQAIVASYFNNALSDKPVNIIRGKNAEMIYSKIIKMGLVARLDHAAYMGYELAKAELALKIGKDYIQDTPLFKKDILGY